MIYVLQLEKGKYYVGYTARRDGERFNEHFNGQGSAWTKKYKPIIVLKWIEGTVEDENRVTLDYMQEYGWTNVRGGEWCQVNMTAPPSALLKRINKQQEIATKNQYCTRCGRNNHNLVNCYAATIHQAGYTHGDLGNGQNVIITNDCLVVIDVEGGAITDHQLETRDDIVCAIVLLLELLTSANAHIEDPNEPDQKMMLQDPRYCDSFMRDIGSNYPEHAPLLNILMTVLKDNTITAANIKDMLSVL